MSKAGAIWIEGGSGGSYLRIKFGEYDYRAYPNKFKKEKWQPDYIIFSRDEMPERSREPREPGEEG